MNYFARICAHFYHDHRYMIQFTPIPSKNRAQSDDLDRALREYGSELLTGLPLSYPMLQVFEVEVE